MRAWCKTLLLASALTVSVALASTDNESVRVEDIRAQQAKLQVEVRAGKGAFKDMDAAERQQLLSKQERVLLILQGKMSLDELPGSERLELFNTLEDIKAIVAKAEDERQVCTRVKVIGSNLPKIVCMTAAQQREQQQRAKEMMQRAQRCADSSCLSSGG